jgi:hypothetical protein
MVLADGSDPVQAPDGLPLWGADRTAANDNQADLKFRQALVIANHGVGQDWSGWSKRASSSAEAAEPVAGKRTIVPESGGDLPRLQLKGAGDSRALADRVVITNANGEIVTQFRNSRANTQQRISNGKWIPQ